MDVTEDLKAVLEPLDEGDEVVRRARRRSTKRWPISSSLPRSELCSATRFESLRSYRRSLTRERSRSRPLGWSAVANLGIECSLRRNLHAIERGGDFDRRDPTWCEERRVVVARAWLGLKMSLPQRAFNTDDCHG